MSSVGNTTLSWEGNNQYALSCVFFDMFDQMVDYCTVENGVLKLSDQAPDSFVLKMVVSVEDKITTKNFKDYIKNKNGSAFYMNELIVTITYSQDPADTPVLPDTPVIPDTPDTSNFSEGLEFYDLYDGENCYVSGIGTCRDTDIVIPPIHNGKNVVGVGYEAFRNCEELTSITIPNSVEDIYGHVFSSCTGLTSITIGNGVTYIGRYAFSDCTKLVSITIPNNVTYLDDYVFYGCTGLKSATIGNGIQSMGKECYEEGLTIFSVPGILKATCQTIYANVTVIDLDISGAAVWFDSTGDKVLSESGNVLEWYDSINLISATSSGSKAPTYKDGVISFDGINDSMIYNHSLSDKGNISIIINARTENSTTDYLDSYRIKNNARYTLLHYPESDSWGSVYFTAFNNGIACSFGSGENNNRGIYYTGSSINGWATVSAVKNGKSEKIYLGSSMVYDRSADTSASYQAGTPGATVKSTHEYAYIGLGIQNSVNYYYNGDVGDIVVFERTLAADEIAVLNEYFNAKNQHTLLDKSDIVSAEFDSFMKNNGAEIHSFDYTTIDVSTHNAVCQDCAYSVTEAHSFEYEERDDDTYVKTCALCGYECEEEHDYEATENADTLKLHQCFDSNAEKPRSSNTTVIVVISFVAVAVTVGVAFVLIWYKKSPQRS